MFPHEKKWLDALALATVRAVAIDGGVVEDIDAHALARFGVELATERGWLEPFGDNGCRVSKRALKKARSYLRMCSALSSARLLFYERKRRLEAQGLTL